MRLKANETLLQESDDFLRRKPDDAAAALKLAKRLIAALLFGRARRVLELTRFEVGVGGTKTLRAIPDAELSLKLGQKHVLATYKDPDLPAKTRLEEAWALLDEADNPDAQREEALSTSNDKWLRQESLGLAGAICKRLWEVDNTRLRLEQSLSYYLRAYALGCVHDAGYTGINAAFVLDRLAGIEQDGGAAPEAVAPRRAQARTIRLDLTTVLPAHEDDEGNRDTWWFPATLAEAFFGLGDIASAETWAQKCAARKDTPEWERESTARQLVALALALRLTRASTLDDFVQTDAGRVLKTLLGGEAAAAAVASAWVGRVGLSLSGGGFRASFFHIGLLARLAELDVLRHVEVLSCVSGGSIVGAHYYLEVRRLLRDTADGAIAQTDYVTIVKNLEREFLAGVQMNLRTRVVGSLWANLRMLVSTSYSRTDRLGELYERHLYARVKDGEEGDSRWLGADARPGAASGSKGLFVTPKDHDRDDFHPVRDNWRRKNKVPVMLLNATTLNTGHNWQFSASWMGEPPASEIDMNERLRRKYYDEKNARPIRLGCAVGASSCVPGLFEPVVLKGVYPERVVRLVDGGVHDNQGVVGLLDQGCDVVIVSDASGQMESQKEPSRGLIGVPLRANSILMARVRNAEFDDLKARRRSGLLRRMLFLHMKQDLGADPVAWLGCTDAKAAKPASPDTSYGVRKDVQTLVAGIRTDLDSFSEVEAYSLMTSGYLMADKLYARHMGGFTGKDIAPRDWQFLRMRTAMQGGRGDAELVRQLKVASQGAFKVWSLSPTLRFLRWVVGAAAAGLLALAVYTWWYEPFFLVRWGVSTLAAIVVATLIGAWLKDIVWFRETLFRWLAGAALAVFGWLVAGVHICVFDRLFLRIGKATSVTD